jgi:galactose mutarotase-like enzyme
MKGNQMNKILKNNIFSVEISKAGAELTSFKNLQNSCEYIWNGDKSYWSGHSPVLFPIVCAANNSTIKVDGNDYKIGNHGFARKSDFELVEETDCKAVYRLSYSEATLAMYPFKFDLYLIYTLEENRLKIEYKVDNVDDKDIYFQIGTHPGFNCPIDNSGKFEDYYIEFQCEENLERLYMNDSNVLIKGKSEKIALINNNVLPLTHDLFNEGALVFKNLKSAKVVLKNDKTDKKVILSYEDLPHMGIWQPKNAPFICIEPWHGLADEDGFNGEFKEKELIVSLKKGNSYKCSYTIEVE